MARGAWIPIADDVASSDSIGRTVLQTVAHKLDDSVHEITNVAAMTNFGVKK